MENVADDRRYQILVESPTHDFLSEATFTKEGASAEIKRRRADGGWDGCKFIIVPAGKYVTAGGAP